MKTMLSSAPPLTLSRWERRRRRWQKRRLEVKHGFASWRDAPREVLVEYAEFLQSRTGGPPR